MLKFFRRIRRRLLDKGNLKKYLIYAVGEILLVVIGILIALQVNNWNENRKSNRAFEQLIDAFEKDLLGNLERATRVIQFAYQKDSLVQLVLSDTLTEANYIVNQDLHALIGTRYLPTIDENLAALLDEIKQIPKRYVGLISLLKEYQDLIEFQNRQEIRALEHSTNYMYTLAEKYDWYNKQDSISRKQRIAFYLNDPLYRNHVSLYQQFSLNGNVRAITAITGLRAVALGLLGKIRQIREGLDNPSIRRYYSSLDFQPFVELDCDAQLLNTEKEAGFRMYFLLQNNRKEPISLFILNEKGEGTNEIKLGPGESQTNFRTNRMFTNTYIVVENEKGCIKKYRAIKDGYLLIE